MFGYERFCQCESVPTHTTTFRTQACFRYHPVRRGVSAVVAVDKHPLGSGGRRRDAEIITAGGIRQTGVMWATCPPFTTSQPALSLNAIGIYTTHFLLPCQADGTLQSGTPIRYYFRRFRRQIVSDKLRISTVLFLLYVSQGFMAAGGSTKLLPILT